MKKKILFVGLLTFSIAISSLSISLNKKSNPNLTMNSIEVLAECENALHVSGPLVSVTVCERRNPIIGPGKCTKESTTSCTFNNL